MTSISDRDSVIALTVNQSKVVDTLGDDASEYITTTSPKAESSIELTRQRRHTSKKKKVMEIMNLIKARRVSNGSTKFVPYRRGLS
ncbi:unnamed protein product [Ilex paraguariensis]|uniref:Uncharacterized protein n=1 Tax=Ilex paraguariensis TaxID=185542 RepID=A0ABC8SES2_9AQUA